MQQITLIILDGWGVNLTIKGNAIAQANTPFIDKIEKSYPFLTLSASGLSVGLPWGEVGNSEVGHMTMGTGRITHQYLPRIVFAIQNGTFFKNPKLKKTAQHIRKNNSSLHIMGLTSSGTVHSYVDHIYGLLEFAKREKISNVFLHAFTDGKDSLPHEAKTFLANLEERINKLNLGKIVTIMGRDFAMDRDNNWDRTEKAYKALTEPAQGKSNIMSSISKCYDQGCNDQNLPPTVLKTQKSTRIQKGDAVIFFNFREDSARQLTRAFVQDKFDGFARNKIEDLYFTTMTKYEDNLPIEVMFEPPSITNSLAEILSKNKKKQLKIAETEKYAHATYFFNGLREKAFSGEARLIIPSLQTCHHNQCPEMKAREITSRFLKELNQNSYNFILANFANADMVGHSGDFKATVKAVEFLDRMLAAIYNAILEKNGILIITGDHGNSEEMLNLRTGNIKTEHTANPVPFYLISKNITKENSDDNIKLIKNEPKGMLSDIAPTILDIMEIKKPGEMTGKSLLSYLE